MEASVLLFQKALGEVFRVSMKGFLNMAVVFEAFCNMGGKNTPIDP